MSRGPLCPHTVARQAHQDERGFVAGIPRSSRESTQRGRVGGRGIFCGTLVAQWLDFVVFYLVPPVSGVCVHIRQPSSTMTYERQSSRSRSISSRTLVRCLPMRIRMRVVYSTVWAFKLSVRRAHRWNVMGIGFTITKSEVHLPWECSLRRRSF